MAAAQQHLRRARRVRLAAAAAAAAVAAATAGPLLSSLNGALAAGRSSSAAFVTPAGALHATAAASSAAGVLGRPPLPEDLEALGQILLAEEERNWKSPFELYGPDPFFYAYIVISAIIVIVGFWLITKPYWEQRWLIERINAQKLKFITQEKDWVPFDQFELGKMYIELKDYPSALAELEEVEEDFDDNRPALDPEDAMGALASRAMLHNSKGYALMKLDPPRPAQARREFVRAVTFWPEYPEALLNIGWELIKRKRYDVAVRTLNTGLKWLPASSDLQMAAEEARKGTEGLLDEDEKK